jgi:hypothetical protein
VIRPRHLFPICLQFEQRLSGNFMTQRLALNVPPVEQDILALHIMTGSLCTILSIVPRAQSDMITLLVSEARTVNITIMILGLLTSLLGDGRSCSVLGSFPLLAKVMLLPSSTTSFMFLVVVVLMAKTSVILRHSRFRVSGYSSGLMQIINFLKW